MWLTEGDRHVLETASPRIRRRVSRHADLSSGPVVPVQPYRCYSAQPFGVPAILSKAFWGGLWGLVLAPILVHLSGASYWAAWILVGAVVLTAVAFFVVPPLKGEPMQAMGPRFLIGMAVNGAWGFGTALILQLLGALRS